MPHSQRLKGRSVGVDISIVSTFREETERHLSTRSSKMEGRRVARDEDKALAPLIAGPERAHQAGGFHSRTFLAGSFPGAGATLQ